MTPVPLLSSPSKTNRQSKSEGHSGASGSRQKIQERINGQAVHRALHETMKLEQGQLWQKGDEYIRIVHWARMAIDYKVLKDPTAKEGTLHQLSKKEFCRLLKGAALVPPQKAPQIEAEPEVDMLGDD